MVLFLFSLKKIVVVVVVEEVIVTRYPSSWFVSGQ
jgi:hypothetical protein